MPMEDNSVLEGDCLELTARIPRSWVGMSGYLVAGIFLGLVLIGALSIGRSGGERRRVLLAQALAQDTEIVLLDEPTAGLDPAHALQLGQAMGRMCERGKALVFTTHDLNLAARFAPRTTLIHDGRLALSGPTLEVLAQAGPLLGVSLHLGRLPSGIPFAVPT